MAYTTINKSSDFFNTKLYSGNGSNGNAQTGVGFQPDWTWIKSRSHTPSNVLIDAVRGVNKHIISNTTASEVTSTGYMASFDSDGFTLNNDGDVNGSGRTYASWNWKANGTGSANSDGSQSSTVSVNTTAGFSIVKFVNNQSYTTNTFGHGLGVVPKLIIMRSLDSAYNWDVYHHKVGNDKRLILNSTATQSNSTYMNSTSPTNQVFTVKSDEFDTNDDCIAYCFAEKTGYSKFGSYVGNGNADGTFVYTGFKPTFVMIKQTTSATDWFIVDNKRPGYNVVNKLLYPNGSYAEGTTAILDFTSQGFKLRSTDQTFNKDGNTFIYMAIGQSLVGSNNVPCTAK